MVARDFDFPISTAVKPLFFAARILLYPSTIVALTSP